MEGYKIFHEGLKNHYGIKMQEGRIYRVDINNKNIKYGNHGYGFHFVKRLEDGLRYFDGLHENIEIAKVQAKGIIREYYDDYYEYYNLYVASQIMISHILSREEILNYILKTNYIRAERFVQGYHLEDDEIRMFIKKFPDETLRKTIDYYQKGNKDAFVKVKR